MIRPDQFCVGAGHGCFQHVNNFRARDQAEFSNVFAVLEEISLEY